MRKLSKLARSAHSHIHRFFSLLVYIIYSAIPKVIKGNCIDCYADLCILRPEKHISEVLARAYKLHVYMIFFFYVSTFGGLAPPPPPHSKTWLRYCCVSVPGASIHFSDGGGGGGKSKKNVKILGALNCNITFCHKIENCVCLVVFLC